MLKLFSLWYSSEEYTGSIFALGECNLHMQIPLVDLQAQYQTIKHEVLAAYEDVLDQMYILNDLNNYFINAVKNRIKSKFKHMPTFSLTFTI
jgi:hypothetical protein